MEGTDGDKASWILEFVLRQPLDDWLVKEILFRLATPPFLDPHLKKALFLRQLSSDLSAGRFSEDTLRSLELLEEVDRYLGLNAAGDALKAAYCAVAAEATVSRLRAGDLGAADFRKVTDRIWNRRVGDLERSEARGLVGEGLREWKRTVGEAIVDKKSRERILQRDTVGEAARALGEYLSVISEDMAPPLLHLMASQLARKSNADGGQEADANATERVKPVGVAAVAPLEADVVAFSSRDDAEPVLPNGAASGAGGALSVEREQGTRRSEMLKRSDDWDKGGTSGIEPWPATEAEVVKEALKSSCIDLRTAVRDPLPEALAKAVAIHSAVVKQHGGEAAGLRRPSLLERNPTARAAEWDEDSGESLSERTAFSPEGVRLPSPRIRRVSPLLPRKDVKFVRRRKMKKWAPDEEDALREAVRKHGTGRWKFILQCHPEVFEDRTEVDLKDKWRNLSR